MNTDKHRFGQRTNRHGDSSFLCPSTGHAGRSLQQHRALHGFGDVKVYRRAYWAERGRENIAAGLTWGGEPRRRPPAPELAEVHGVARKVIRNQQRAQRFMAQGLTWRGTKRKRRPVAHLVRVAWNEFRSQRDVGSNL